MVIYTTIFYLSQEYFFALIALKKEGQIFNPLFFRKMGLLLDRSWLISFGIFHVVGSGRGWIFAIRRSS